MVERRIVNRRDPPINRRKLREQALISAQRLPPVSEGLMYVVTADIDGDRLEVSTRQAYAAILVSEALADKLRTPTHLMLGRRVIVEETPKRRRLNR